MLLAVTEALALLAPTFAGTQGAPISEPALTLRDDLVFFEDFEGRNWTGHWSQAGNANNTELVGAPEAFAPAGQQSLKIRVNANDHYGASLTYKCNRMPGGEPEELYFRYYLKFDADWNCQGGKLPGFGGTYGRAGWGGRPVNGSDGWSSRGQFGRVRGDTVPIGWYCYHADMRGRYGSAWDWQQQNRGYLKKGVWYCVEGYVKLNTPGQQGQRGRNDGILRGWVNGQPAFEKTDIRFRDVPALKIENVWFNVYNGGTWTYDKDCHLYIDNVVIARNYIGPYVSMQSLRDSIRQQYAQKRQPAEPPKPPKEPPDRLLREALANLRETAASEPQAARQYLDGLKPKEKDAAAFGILRRGLDAGGRLHEFIRSSVQSGATAKTYVSLAGSTLRGDIAGVEGDELVVKAAGMPVRLPLASLDAGRLFALSLTLAGQEPPAELLLNAACYGLVHGVDADKVKGVALWLPAGQENAAEREALLELLALLCE